MTNPPEAEIRAGSLRSKTRRLVQGHRAQMLPPDSAAHYQENFAGLICSVICLSPSDPIASFPSEEDEGRNQRRDDKHPVLTFETKNGKMPNEKLHHSRPHFYAG
jgi:hypothetical protein